MQDDRWVTLADPNIRPVDEVLEEVFQRYGMRRMGGASGRGWSSFAAFQKCPYYYHLRTIGVRGTPSSSLETGAVFHEFLALHYSQMMDPNLKLSPEVLKSELLDSGCDAKNVLEAWRLYDAYTLRYENDYLHPLAVEYWAQDPDGNTCRFDLIARVDDGQSGVVPGTYIVEHKSASRFDAATLDGWRNDGEVIGQIMVWKRARLFRRFGSLRGVIVNVVGKQRVVQFHRTVVSAQSWHVRQHMDDLKVWRAFQNLCEVTSTWPRSRANCITRYGFFCEMFDFCAENRKPDTKRRTE